MLKYTYILKKGKRVRKNKVLKKLYIKIQKQKISL